MPVQIGKKQYKTVAERVSEFRADYQEFAIETNIIRCDDIVQIKATIKNDSERVIATGYAEEVRGSTNINKTSALENCETSAIGRALAAFGLGGTEYASANEVTDAIIQQQVMEVKANAIAYYRAMGEAITRNWESVVAIKAYLATGENELAIEAFNEIDHSDQTSLWVAPTKGGIFSTEDRKTLKGE